MNKNKNKTLFFNQFFDELNKTSIDYCIMNGYENYPTNLDGDIDIIINSYQEFEIILDKLSKKLNYKIVQKLKHGYGGYNFFIIKNRVFLYLDIYPSYIVNNRILFNNNFFLEDKIKYKNFYIPSKEKEFLYYFVKKIVKQDIDISIEKLFKIYQQIDIQNIKICYFFKNNCKKIISKFNQKDKEYFIKNKKILRNDLLNSVKITPKLLVMEILRKIKRIILPTGFIVSFLGSDGSGKSTTIEELSRREVPFRRIEYFHLKPRLIGTKGDGKPVENPHAKKTYGGILSYLKLFYFMSDYIVGFFAKILPLKIQSSLVIFDRYYDDILLDPKRFRYGGSLKFAKFMRFFIPKPDIYFVLVADADILYKRKQEVEFSELERQLTEYRSLADRKRYILIDVNRNVKEIVDDIEILIYRKVNERY